MKRFISILLSIVLILSFTSCSEKQVDETTSTTPEVSEPTLTVTPILSPYDSQNGHAVWDMKLWDGFLHIGAGDYDRNYTVDVGYRYDLDKEEWDKCGLVSDEQVSRFLEIRGQLVIPGIDPKGSWDSGQYYIFIDGRFEPQCVIPGGIHNFDIVEYDGVLFFGTGVLAGSYPVARSDQNGENLVSVPFLDQKGNKLSTLGFSHVRCYDLVVLNDELYAVLTLDSEKNTFKYNGSEFVFYSGFGSKVNNGRHAYVPIMDKKVLGDTLYFTSGKLYATNDMDFYKDITPAGLNYVADILVYDDTLYALTNERNADDGYDIKVLKMSEDETFTEVFKISNKLAAMSFEYDGTDYYIGLGTRSEPHLVKETILKVTLG